MQRKAQDGQRNKHTRHKHKHVTKEPTEFRWAFLCQRYQINMYKDFDIFSRALIASKDVDPIYPFIKSLLDVNRNWMPEWFCFAYVNMYSLESAIKFCRDIPSPVDWIEGDGASHFIDMRESGFINKMGHERRGSQRAINNQYMMFDTAATAILNNSLDLDSQLDFKASVTQNVHMYGPWATFKIAEVYEKALDIKSLKIPDLGINERDPNSNDGPIGGLRWLYGRDNVYDKSIFPTWNKFGENLAKSWNVDIGEVESSLCKWHKIVTGKYYIGHDIDELWELKEIVGEGFEDIMMANFGIEFVTLRHGVDRKMKQLYKDTGKILNANFATVLPKGDVLQILLETE